MILFYQFSPTLEEVLPIAPYACGVFSFLAAGSDFYSLMFEKGDAYYWLERVKNGYGVHPDSGEALWHNLIKATGLDKKIYYDDIHHIPDEMPDYKKVAFVLLCYKQPGSGNTHFVYGKLHNIHGQIMETWIHEPAGNKTFVHKEGYELVSTRWFWKI